MDYHRGAVIQHYHVWRITSALTRRNFFRDSSDGVKYEWTFEEKRGKKKSPVSDVRGSQTIGIFYRSTTHARLKNFLRSCTDFHFEISHRVFKYWRAVSILRAWHSTEAGWPRFRHLSGLRWLAGELPAGPLSDLIRKGRSRAEMWAEGFDSGVLTPQTDVNRRRTELEQVTERSRDRAAAAEANYANVALVRAQRIDNCDSSAKIVQGCKLSPTPPGNQTAHCRNNRSRSHTGAFFVRGWVRGDSPTTQRDNFPTWSWSAGVRRILIWARGVH